MSELEIYQRNEGIRPVITGYLHVCNVCVCYRQGVDTVLLPLTPQLSYTNTVP